MPNAYWILSGLVAAFVILVVLDLIDSGGK
jgi:hypothetical protein